MKIKDASVAMAESGRALVVRCGLEQPQAGHSVGWQLYDPETGLFLVEGEWVPAAAEVLLQVELPPQSGSYRVYVSTVDPERGWAYQRGQHFLAIDATVHDGGVRVDSRRLTTLGGMRRAMLPRSLVKALVLPFASIWKNRHLIRAMVRRDVAARYRGSFGDVAWALLHPLMLMLTYFFVFGIVLQARFPGDATREGFVLYFLAGMLPWLAVSEAAARAPSVVLEHRNFVKKLVFPVETLPVNLVVAALVTELFAMGVFLAGLLLLRGMLPVSALWLPVVLVPQVLLALGIAWLVAGIGVFLRDLGQISSFLLTLWFFLTPICYPEASLPAPALAILRKNPMYVLVSAYRAIFLEGRAPDFGPMWKLCLLSAAIFVLGHALFYRLRKTFADVI